MVFLCFICFVWAYIELDAAIIVDSFRSEHAATITSAGLKVYNNMVEPGSCHDPHGMDGHIYFLTLDPANGELCLACHKK